MGFMCPTCLTHQPIKQNITTHQLPVNAKASDVVAYRLACGHTVGGKDYEAYQKELARIQTNTARQIAELRENEKDAITQAFMKVQSAKGKGVAK